MSQCASNFSVKYVGKLCNKCGKVDDESHRINNCRNFESRNFCDNSEKINYDDIYSCDKSKCLKVLYVILSMWDLENGKNEMRV